MIVADLEAAYPHLLAALKEQQHGDGLTVALTPEIARALLAADPFGSANTSDWIKGRDILLNALASMGSDGGTDRV